MSSCVADKAIYTLEKRLQLDPDLAPLVEKHLGSEAGSGLSPAEQGPRDLVVRSGGAELCGRSGRMVSIREAQGKKRRSPSQGGLGLGAVVEEGGLDGGLGFLGALEDTKGSAGSET